MSRGRFIMLQRITYDPKCPEEERDRVIRLFFPNHDPGSLRKLLAEANGLRRNGDGRSANDILSKIAEAP